MIPALLIIVGIVLVVVSGKLTKDRVIAAHGVFSRETVQASNVDKTIPRWVSLVNLSGYVAVILGIGAAIARIV